VAQECGVALGCGVAQGCTAWLIGCSVAHRVRHGSGVGVALGRGVAHRVRHGFRVRCGSVGSASGCCKARPRVRISTQLSGGPLPEGTRAELNECYERMCCV
jgi:hypothetical protein